MLPKYYMMMVGLFVISGCVFSFNLSRPDNKVDRKSGSQSKVRQNNTASNFNELLYPEEAKQFVFWWLTSALDFSTNKKEEHHRYALRWMDEGIEEDLAKLYKIPAKKYTLTHTTFDAKRIDDRNASVDGFVGMGNPGTKYQIAFTYEIHLNVRMDDEGFRISKFKIPQEQVIRELSK